MAESDEILTMEEYLHRDDQLQKEALNKYPAKFDKCSYDLGYIRQSLFVCLSCTPPASGRTGEGADAPAASKTVAVCYACSIACHFKCELIELGPKRHHRCDCGNSNFPTSARCTLTEEKDYLNPENGVPPRTIHNFEGKFCSCDVPYGENNDLGDMLQCTLCEDWFHEGCLGDEIPSEDDFDELICPSCVEAYLFLSPLATIKGDSEVTVDVDDDLTHQGSSICLSSYGLPAKTKGQAKAKALFLKETFRDFLCHCEKCTKLLKDNGIDFIYSVEPIYEPEEDKDAGSIPLEGIYIRSTFHLNHGILRLSHLVVVNALDKNVNRADVTKGVKAMDRFRASLMEFLKPHLEQKRIVTKDVHHIFLLGIFILILF